jgi:hypothetical protein
MQVKARTSCNQPGESPGALGGELDPPPLMLSPWLNAQDGTGAVPCDFELFCLGSRVCDRLGMVAVLAEFRRAFPEIESDMRRQDTYIPPVLRGAGT